MAKDTDFPVIYSNLARLTHGPLEFLVDFKRLGPEAPDIDAAPTEVRIILHPVIAKALRDAFTENVARYEEQFGEIPAPPKGSGPIKH